MYRSTSKLISSNRSQAESSRWGRSFLPTTGEAQNWLSPTATSRWEQLMRWWSPLPSGSGPPPSPRSIADTSPSSGRVTSRTSSWFLTSIRPRERQRLDIERNDSQGSRSSPGNPAPLGSQPQVVAASRRGSVTRSCCPGQQSWRPSTKDQRGLETTDSSALTVQEQDGTT